MKKQTLHGINHHATAFLKGKLSIISSSQESCFLTADGVDLNAPEGEREELFISARQQGLTDMANTKNQAQSLPVFHPRTPAPYLGLLCPVMCQSVNG